MFSRIRTSLWCRRRGVMTVLVAVTALVAGCIAAVEMTARPGAPAAQPGTPVPVHVVHGRPVRVPVMRAWRRPVTSWPAPGRAMVAVRVLAPRVGRVAGRAGAGPSAGSVRAGGLPVWVGPPVSAATSVTTSAVRGLRAGLAGAADVSRVMVSVASQGVARALGIKGTVLSLAQVGVRAASGQVHVSVSYAGFAQAYGGDYGSRLRLVELSACALRSPAVAACRTQKPVGSANDARRDWVGADVTLPGAATASVASGPGAASPGVALTAALAGPAVVMAVVPGPSGSAGNFAAEPLSEATNDWVTGPSSGAFSYSYPITVPPVPGGLVPTVALQYSSQATSGLTSSTNNEASWVGDGWDYSPGFIETDYSTCSQQALEPDTGDLCPGQGEVAMSLNGVTTPLVDGSSGWQAEDDSGATINRSGTSWEVIEPNGVQYWFGVNQLPGYASGDAATNSVWDAPVWEGCGQAAFCNVPWRVNLDYVVDPHGDAIAYFYAPQTNYYAEQDGTTGTGAYTQGGALVKIEYGLRAGQVYTSTPAAEVLFTTTSSRQDAPADLACAAGAACAVTSPTFWTDDELTGITTQALVAGSFENVDSWALDGTYPATGDPTTSPSLWLSSIARTGLDGSTAVTLPPTSFAGTPLPNRVQTAADTAAGYSQLTRFYLSSITSDTGAVTTVGYSAPDPAPCAAGSFPAPDDNTAACYPDYWVPPGTTSPVQDWFNLYSAASVTAADTTGGDPSVVTSYSYTGPAWHFDNDTISRSAQVTWDEWRGYQQVTTETGTPPDPVTETTDTYLQGMSQDGPSSDPGPIVQLSTSHGQQVTDSDQFAGMLLEKIVYNGAGTGQEVTDTINLPWSSSAAEVNTSLDQAAYMTGDSSTLTYTALAGGGARESTQSYTYNSYGLQASDSDVPDTSNAAESTCTTTAYAVNTATWLLNLPAIVTVDAGACNASGQGTGALVSETAYLYDGGGLGAAPTAGNVTKTEKATAAGSLDTSTATYDEYGRVLTSTNPDDDTTTTAYTPATGTEPTSVQVTDPMGLVTTTTYDPARELPLTVTQPDGGVTTTAYDALGRQTAEWTPGNPTSGPSTTTWGYTVSSTAPSVTTEQQLEPDGNYLTTDTIDDSFGNVVEVQQETADGGTDVTDTTYNSDGWKALASGPYYVSGPPSGILVQAAASSVPDQTGYDYDGDGRVTRQIAYSDGTETWETDTTYGGDYVTVVPPVGGTSTTTFTDGRGLTTAIDEYHAGVPATPTDPAADYDQTTYTYTPGQKLATITDAADNVWSFSYDLLGDELSVTDPDTGTTTSKYDPAGLLLSVTDARGKTTSYTYDADGRKIGEYDTTGGAAEISADQIASWTYDTLAKGLLTSKTSYSGGAAYTEQATGYNAAGQPTGLEVIIPAAQGALAGTYTQTYTYAPTGQETSYTDSAAGGLPAETVTTGYNSAGQPDSLTGASPYVDQLSYTDLDQPLQYQENTSSAPVYVTDSYNAQTGDLSEQNTQTGTAQTSIDDLHYSYDDVGDITSEADTPAGAPGATDVQCFQYDYLGRLVEAWAQGSVGCAQTPSTSAEGGAAPYWESFTYAPTGTMTGETSTTPSGAVTTTANTYPAAGAAQPHAVTSQAVTTSSGTTTTGYTYNADGQLTGVAGGSANESLTWNDVGQLSQMTTTPTGGTAQQTSYIYDADGNLLLTSDPGTTTLSLNDEELSLNTASGVITGTRYYTLGSTTVAARTGANFDYLASDQQGTAEVAIDSQTLDVVRRYYDPYGNPRDAIQPAFPTGEKGFVGGTTDAVTGLTNLGARELQPSTASFISPDPILNPYDPQDLNAYAYANDNPATDSDPTGASSQGSGPTVNPPYELSRTVTGSCYEEPSNVVRFVGTVVFSKPVFYEWAPESYDQWGTVGDLGWASDEQWGFSTGLVYHGCQNGQIVTIIYGSEMVARTVTAWMVCDNQIGAVCGLPYKYTYTPWESYYWGP
jgi:RHS repeat-associated protein